MPFAMAPKIGHQRRQAELPPGGRPGQRLGGPALGHVQRVAGNLPIGEPDLASRVDRAAEVQPEDACRAGESGRGHNCP